MELCHLAATPHQGHGRSAHGLHRGVTDIQPGLITSKMFDKVTFLHSFSLQLIFAACHCGLPLRLVTEICLAACPNIYLATCLHRLSSLCCRV